MINGIMIDQQFEKQYIRRNLYNITNLGQELGGFISIISIGFLFLFNLVKNWTMEKELTSRLYKTHSKPQTGSVYFSKSHLLYGNITDSLKQRQKIKPQSKLFHIFEQVRQIFHNKCCLCCRYTHDDYLYMKARTKLASELDIQRILSSLRLFRNFIKFRMTKTERRLLRMQEDNVVTVTDAQIKDLTKKL